MNLRDVTRNTLADMQAGNPVIWKGPPGFGKTDGSLKLFEDFKALHPGENVGLCRTFMATKQSVDFTGLPWKGERVHNGVTYTVTDPAIPGWFMSDKQYHGESLPASCYDRVMLVIEEWGQGEPETKRAAAPLLWEAGIDPFYLPPGSPRLALTNIDARDGVTKEFDFVIGRRGEYEITGDVDVWVEDFADKHYNHNGTQWLTMAVTKAWAKANPQIIFEPKPQKQGPWCNPRTLCMVDRYAQVMAAENNGVIPIDSPAFMDGVAGKIGMAACQSYIGTLKFMIDLPSYEKVVADPTGTPVPSKADLQMLMAYELAGRCKPEHLAECITYIQKLPKDMSVTFVSSLLRRDYKGMINQPAMQGWIAKNASLVALINSLT